MTPAGGARGAGELVRERIVAGALYSLRLHSLAQKAIAKASVYITTAEIAVAAGVASA
jgi:hypothetical protein